MPETPCLFENQTAVFLKCAEIDCALESAKKPRTAGLCGRAAGACDCGPLSCSTIERVNKGQKPPEQGMVRRKNTLPKGSFLHRRSRIHTDFSHIAHKRRNTRFKGLRRVHTPPQPLTAHTAAHTAKHGGGNEEPPHVGRLGCMESLWSGAVTPVFPPPFFQSSPAGSAFLPVSSPCCREPCALSCSQCAGMFQTDPIHYPVFPCR